MNQPVSPNRYAKREGAKPGRVDLTPQEFENLIEDQGIKIKITPSVVCPNRTALGDTNHALDCQVCNGDEVVDLEDQCLEDWGVIQSIKHDREFNTQGLWDIKDAQLTTKASTRLYYWYRIEVLDFSSIFNELILKSDDNKDKLRYRYAISCDTPSYAVDKLGVSYQGGEGKDYVIDGDRGIRWLANRPASGTLFSLSYPVIPTFRVLETVHENRYYYTSSKSPEKVPVHLPQTSILRWDFMANRSGSRELLK